MKTIAFFNNKGKTMVPRQSTARSSRYGSWATSYPPRSYPCTTSSRWSRGTSACLRSRTCSPIAGASATRGILVGLKNLGPTLRQWRHGWQRLLSTRPPEVEFELPKGELAALGYVTMLYAINAQSRPTQAYQRWMRQIPEVYRRSVLDRDEPGPPSVEADSECLGVLKHYRSLMPMAQDVRKPIFRLRPADGAMGSHARAVRDAYQDFEQLAWAIARRSGIAR